MRQQALFGIDMRPLCPLCGNPSSMLGQYSPLWPGAVCRACSLAEPYPIEIFEPDANTKDRSGLRIKPDSDYTLRELRVSLDALIRDAVKPRLTEWTFPYKVNISLRELRNPIRYGKATQYANWLSSARMQNSNRQIFIPWCGRCGCVHDYLHGEDYAAYCILHRCPIWVVLARESSRREF